METLLDKYGFSSLEEFRDEVVTWVNQIDSEALFRGLNVNLNRVLKDVTQGSDEDEKVLDFLLQVKELCFPRPLDVWNLSAFSGPKEILSDDEIATIYSEQLDFEGTEVVSDQANDIRKRSLGDTSSVESSALKIVRAFEPDIYGYDRRVVYHEITTPLFVNYAPMEGAIIGNPFHFDQGQHAMFSIITVLDVNEDASSLFVRTMGGNYQRVPTNKGQSVMIPARALPHFRTKLGCGELTIMAVGVPDPDWEEFVPPGKRSDLSNKILNIDLR